MSLILSLVVAGLVATPQDAPAVFEVNTDVITKQIRFVGRDHKCPTSLTAEDWVVVTDKNAPVSLDVSESPVQPCSYLLSFTPPVIFRDGKQHELKVKVRIEGKWRRLSFPWRVDVPQPKTGG
jgi:hypothetical protein